MQHDHDPVVWFLVHEPLTPLVCLPLLISFEVVRNVMCEECVHGATVMVLALSVTTKSCQYSHVVISVQFLRVCRQRSSANKQGPDTKKIRVARVFRV